jgi:iron(III) transport system substrate-binding protein
MPWALNREGRFDMMATKRFLVLSIALLALTILLAPAGSEGATAAGPLQALYEAAKAEGEVAFWGPSDPDEMTQLTAAFNKRFPGIKVKPFEITAGQLTQRIVTEGQAGRISADAAQGGVSTINPLLERNLIQGYNDWGKLFQGKELAINPKGILFNGKVLIWYNLSHPIGYNTNLMRREEVPKTWEDLLNPKWKDGKILVEARAKAFGDLGKKWGEQKMVDYVRKIAAQKPIFSKGGTNTLQQLAAGEAPLAIGVYGYKVIWYARDKKAPIDFIDTTSPIGCNTTGAFAVKGAKHPNAAKLFTGWLVTPEALKIMEMASFKGPLIPGSETAEYKRYMKNNVELLIETPETAKLSEILEKKSSEALGAIR